MNEIFNYFSNTLSFVIRMFPLTERVRNQCRLINLKYNIASTAQQIYTDSLNIIYDIFCA